MPPICDNSRLILGIIASLGGILFASMTSALGNDIRNLIHHLFHSDPLNNQTDLRKHAGGASRFLKWSLLVVSFLTTILLGPYVAAVPSKTCVNLALVNLVCDPEGDDLPGEKVELHNSGGWNINMNHWTLCDYQSRHCYEFSDTILRGNSSLTIWTNCGMDTETDLHFCEKTPIWNNGADTAYLFDAKDQLIDQLSCPEP